MKCAVSGREIYTGDPIIIPTMHLHPGDAAPVLVSAIRMAFNNTVVVEELRREVMRLRTELGGSGEG